MSIAFQPAGITGFILLATRRRDLPPGSLSAIFVVNTVLLTKQESTFPFIFVGVGTGVVADALMWLVKGGEKVYHCGGGIVYHRHDEKGLNWEPDGIRSGAGVRSSGVSQESTGSSDTWEAALCRLCLRR